MVGRHRHLVESWAHNEAKRASHFDIVATGILFRLHWAQKVQVRMNKEIDCSCTVDCPLRAQTFAYIMKLIGK